MRRVWREADPFSAAFVSFDQPSAFRAVCAIVRVVVCVSGSWCVFLYPGPGPVLCYKYSCCSGKRWDELARSPTSGEEVTDEQRWMRGDGGEGSGDGGGGAIKPVCLTPDVPLVALAQTIVVWNLRNAFDRLARVDGGGGGVEGVCWTTTKQPPWGGAREEIEERSSARSTDQSVWLIGHFKRKINDKNKDINLSLKDFCCAKFTFY